MRQIPKPDLQKIAGAIGEQTDLACTELGEEHRKKLQLIVVRAMERGVELQREVMLEQEQETPLLPPPTEPPAAFDPPPNPKMPKGV